MLPDLIGLGLRGKALKRAHTEYFRETKGAVKGGQKLWELVCSFKTGRITACLYVDGSDTVGGGKIRGCLPAQNFWVGN